MLVVNNESLWIQNIEYHSPGYCIYTLSNVKPNGLRRIDNPSSIVVTSQLIGDSIYELTPENESQAKCFYCEQTIENGVCLDCDAISYRSKHKEQWNL